MPGIMGNDLNAHPSLDEVDSGTSRDSAGLLPLVFLVGSLTASGRSTGGGRSVGSWGGLGLGGASRGLRRTI